MKSGILVSLGTAFLLSTAVLASTATNPVVICDDGGWCWYQDERAIFVGNDLLVGSLSSGGDVDVSILDMPTMTSTTITLHASLEVDDHDLASFLHRDDGYVMAFYSKHGSDNLMRYRVTSTNASDLTQWEPEQTLDHGAGVTYSNPFQLSDEDGKIYLFFRGSSIDPHYYASTNRGDTWSGAFKLMESPGERPYVKYASDGSNTVHFIYTEAHPDAYAGTSIYHMYYRNGGLYQSDGTFITNLVDAPIAPQLGTKIYDGANATGEGWTWDVHLDTNGYPVVPYATFASRSPDDHRYRYARWDGSQWHDHQVAYGGTRLYDSQASYSGGICVDPEQPEVVYISSDVNITNGQANSSGMYELYRGVTPDLGATWEWRTITSNSPADNLRPIVPIGHTNETTVLWLNGTYTTYSNYDLDVLGLFGSNVVVETPAIPLLSAYHIDINNGNASETAPGWVGLDVPESGSGGTVTSGGITFSVVGADGSRLRTSGGAVFDDFAFDDGPGEDVGIQFGGAGDLRAGVWEVDVYLWDSDSQPGDMIVLYRENGVEHIVGSYVYHRNNGPAVTFRFVSDGVSVYDLFVRENNSDNRSRLNAIELRYIDYKIDINDADASVTEPGWSGLDAAHTGHGGSFTTNDVAFELFTEDGAALRGSVGSPDPDALLGDFGYDDGAGNVAVGLVFGGAGDIQPGRWLVDVYMYDANYDTNDITANIGLRRNSNETIVGQDIPGSATGAAHRFSFVSDGASAYDVFARERNAGNLSRLNAVWLRPATGMTEIVRYDMNDCTGFVSAAAATVTTPEEVDYTAPYVMASPMTSITNWGMDVPPVNGNLARNSEDGHVWWSRGSLLPGAADTNTSPFTAFTLSTDPRYSLDLSEGTLLLRVGVGDAATGTYAFNAHVYHDEDGSLTPLGSASSLTSRNTANLPDYRDVAFDLSALGEQTVPVTLRLYFSDGSSQTGHYPLLDTVAVIGDTIALPPRGSVFIVR